MILLILLILNNIALSVIYNKILEDLVKNKKETSLLLKISEWMFILSLIMTGFDIAIELVSGAYFLFQLLSVHL